MFESVVKMLKFSKAKYPYPRIDMTIRVSEELHGLLAESANDLKCNLQDVVLSCILNMIDPSQNLCPDWELLADELR